jgi:hypothetical protein
MTGVIEFQKLRPFKNEGAFCLERSGGLSILPHKDFGMNAPSFL